MERRGRSYKRNPYRVMRQRLSALMAFVLTVSVILGNGAVGPGIALAGQDNVEQEFRLHVEDIRTAAAEALEQGEPLEEPLNIGSDSEDVLKSYEKFLDADGTLYEIFPEYITTSNIEEMELRVFLRAEKAADEAYELTGDEKLVFLYVNHGKRAVDVRLNVDGYVSKTNTVNAYETEFGAPEEDLATDSNAAEIQIPVPEAGTEADTQKPADVIVAPEETPAAEPETPAETTAPDSQSTIETAAPDPDNGTPEETPAIPEETPAIPEETPAQPTETETSTEESATTTEAVAEPSEESDGEDQMIEIVVPETDEEQNDGESADGSNVSVDGAEPQVGISQKQTYRVAQQATPSNVIIAEEKDDTAADTESDDDTDDDEYLDDVDLINDLEDEAYEEKGHIKGIPYRTVSLDDSMTARAFVTTLKAVSEGEENAEEGMYLIDYFITTAAEEELDLAEEATAELVNAPEQAAEGSRVTFGIIPQEGYEVSRVTANDMELALADEAELASPSNAEEIASESNAEMNVEGAVYYTIPEVFEEQYVTVELAKVVEPVEPEFPAFEKAVEVGTGNDKVTVTVSAGEGILDPDTEVNVEKVSADVEEAVKAKVNAKNADKPEEEQKKVTSVLAYDIELKKDGEKLNGSWGADEEVLVKFEGTPIEELSKESEVIQTAVIETADLTEEESVIESEIMPLSLAPVVSDIEVNTDGQKQIQLESEESIQSVNFAMRSTATMQAVFGVAMPLADDIEQDKANLQVAKTFVCDDFNYSEYDTTRAIYDDVVQKFQDFKINLKHDGITQELTIQEYAQDGYSSIDGSGTEPANGVVISKIDGGTSGKVTIVWAINDLKPGTYIVSESGENLTGYSVKRMVNEKVIVEGHEEPVKTVAATVQEAHGERINKTQSVYKVGEINFFVAQLNSGGGYFVWTRNKLSDTQQEAFKQKIAQLNLGANIGTILTDKCVFLSEFDISEGAHFEYREGTFEYDGHMDLTLSNTDNWSHMVFGNIVFSKPAEIYFTNTYTKVEFDLVKAVEGNIENGHIPSDSSIVFEVYEDMDEDGIPDNNTPCDLTEKGSQIIFDSSTEFTYSESDKYSYSTPVTLRGLEVGTYLLQEKITVPGYDTLLEYIPIIVMQVEDKMVCKVVSNPGKWVWTDATVGEDGESTKGVLKIYNKQGIKLPDTGGPGLLFLKRFGWMLILLAMMGLEVETLNKRKRKAEK